MKWITIKLTRQQAEAALDALGPATAGTLEDEWLDQDTSESERTRVVYRVEAVRAALFRALKEEEP